MSSIEFYKKYKERLENKLADKTAHIARINMLMPTLSDEQKKTYAHILTSANTDRKNIVHELAEINQFLANNPSKEINNE